MRYILDSSVGVKWVLPEKDFVKARRLRDEFQLAIHELLSPDIFTAELAHALTRAERQVRITTGEALRLWAVVMTTSPHIVASQSLTPRAIEISSQMRFSSYDCIYVALAEREGCELVTADDKLVKTLQPTFPFITPLSSLP